MSAILVNGEIIHYEVLGRGRPILFLHGWVGSWRYWIPAMQSASASYRAYALDFYGFGDTVKNRQRYSLQAQADLIEEFMQNLGIGRLAIVGHGLGALVGLRFAAQHPGVVERVMAVSLALHPDGINPRLRTTRPADLVAGLLDRAPEFEPVRRDAQKTDPQAVLVSLQDLQQSGLDRPWSLLDTHTLLVYGSMDPLVSLGSEKELTAGSRQIHTVIFEGASHFPMLDDSSKFCRLLQDFLALKPGESPQELQLKEEWKRRIR